MLLFYTQNDANAANARCALRSPLLRQLLPRGTAKAPSHEQRQRHAAQPTPRHRPSTAASPQRQQRRISPPRSSSGSCRREVLRRRPATNSLSAMRRHQSPGRDPGSRYMPNHTCLPSPRDPYPHLIKHVSLRLRFEPTTGLRTVERSRISLGISTS